MSEIRATILTLLNSQPYVDFVRLQVSKLMKNSNAINATAVITIHFWALFRTLKRLPAIITKRSSYKVFDYFIVTLFYMYIVQAPKKTRKRLKDTFNWMFKIVIGCSRFHS